MDTIMNLMDQFWFQAIIKLLLAAILTGFIGLERSSLNKPAGFGTHAIIGTTGALVVLISEYLSINNQMDVSRLPAQLLSGIGFIGAGTILHNGLNVKGVTTAAGILAVTAIGLTVGSGFYFGAILATIIVYFLLTCSHKISDKLGRFNDLDIRITIEDNSKDTLPLIKKYLLSHKIKIKGMELSGAEKINTGNTIEVVGNYDARYITLDKMITDLISIENVVEVISIEE